MEKKRYTPKPGANTEQICQTQASGASLGSADGASAPTRAGRRKRHPYQQRVLATPHSKAMFLASPVLPQQAH
jgi:hypothetical protein